jgi:hypothetical protein
MIGLRSSRLARTRRAAADGVDGPSFMDLDGLRELIKQERLRPHQPAAPWCARSTR